MQKCFGILLLFTTLTGCANNYDFESQRGSGGRFDVSQMMGDLDDHHASTEESELYDFACFPLVHTRIRVLAEVDDEEAPDGYILADIDMFLPIFGFVNADIERFDRDRTQFERHEVRSRFWGLCTRHTELVATTQGIREETHRSFLWFLRWTSSPKYTADESFTSAGAEALALGSPSVGVMASITNRISPDSARFHPPSRGPRSR